MFRIYSYDIQHKFLKANYIDRNLFFFRRRGNFTVAQQISDMFRVFVPVFNNQENTVITPLLATGHQVGISTVLRKPD